MAEGSHQGPAPLRDCSTEALLYGLTHPGLVGGGPLSSRPVLMISRMTDRSEAREEESRFRYLGKSLSLACAAPSNCSMRCIHPVYISRDAACAAYIGISTEQ